MKLHIHFQSGDLKVDETVEGAHADEIVAAMQKLTAQKAGFLVGSVIRNMTPLQFAREATRRYNTAIKEETPLPDTCADFVKMGIARNFATQIEE